MDIEPLVNENLVLHCNSSLHHVYYTWATHSERTWGNSRLTQVWTVQAQSLNLK